MRQPNDTIGKLEFTDEEFRRFIDVLDAAPSTGVVRLAQLAGLPPGRAFRHAILRDVEFTKDDILRGYDFTDSDFTGADVRGADLSEATGLDKAILTGVVADTATRWPATLRPIGSLVLIPPGSFTIGTTATERSREKMSDSWGGISETPRRKVTFVRGFLLGRYPVTVGEFRRFVAETSPGIRKGSLAWDPRDRDFERSPTADWENPGFPQRDGHPVTCINHMEATAYADWLKTKTGKDYRLPSESEWEYACRAGTKTARFWGNDRDDAARYANVADLSLAAVKSGQVKTERFFLHDDGYPFTAPVGSFLPNQFGLYDMLGNVWEWCEDHWIDRYDALIDTGKPRHTTHSDTLGVRRGGSWYVSPSSVRSGARDSVDRRERFASTGFRVARTLSTS